MRSKGCPRHLAVSPPRFFGRSANWIPLSVSTVWMRYGTAPTSASRKAAAACISAFSTSSTTANFEGASQLWNRGLQGVQTVIERQQSVLAKRNDDGLLLDGQDGGVGNGWPRSMIGG